MLSLECEWFRCSVKHIFDGPLWIFDAAQPIVPGMSGSPIISDKCKAIGTVTLGPPDGTPGLEPGVRLFRSLPGWLLRSNPRRTRKLFKQASRQLS
jgi:hypothetical protein